MAGVLLIALGIARGLGGTLLILHGPALDSGMAAPPEVAAWVGLGLIAVGLLALASGAGVLLGRRGSIPLGVVAVVAFLVDGAVNGWLLFGRPRVPGTLLNLATAALILAFLLAGRRSLRER